MKYLIQTDSIDTEKSKDVDYGRVVLDTTDSSIYVVGYGINYKTVDLGLTSGTLWMDRNVGAEKPEDYGLYFAWGETQGYSGITSDKQFSWTDYKYANGASDKLTKYCNSSSYGNDGFTDNLTTLETTDDSALQNAHKFVMPTKAQIVELIKETDVYCIKADSTEVHGTYQEGTGEGELMIAWDSDIDSSEKLSGIEFRRKSDNSIKVFVPCAGNGDEGSMSYVGLVCGLWASSLSGDYPGYAWGLGFGYDGGACSGNDRYIGLPVRGVVVAAQ